MPTKLDQFFCPKSVAIVGASRNPKKLGAIILKNIIESNFGGPIYPVNPNASDINGLKCYPNVSDIGEVPDLVLFTIPSKIVAAELEDAGKDGVKNIVIFTAGYKEIGKEGLALEKELIKIAKKYEMNVLGPNCLGFVNTQCPINATFAESTNKPGNITFISQSGALAASIFDWAKTADIGYADFITIGNKAILSENDILEYLLNKSDENLIKYDRTGLSNLDPIGLYLESIENGSRFLELSKEISKKNPIIILKPGKTSAAASAMQSHTGSMAGEDAVLDAVLKQANIIRSDTLEEFFDYLRAFAWEDIPAGPKVGIISNAGGPAVISTDAVIMNGLELPVLKKETQDKLAKVLPRAASMVNPVDVLGDSLADRFIESADIMLASDQVDVLVPILTPQVMTQIQKTAQGIGELSAKHGKPILCSFIGGSQVTEGERILNAQKIPSFRFPENAIKAIAKMWQFRVAQEELSRVSISMAGLSNVDEKGIRGVVEGALKRKETTLDNIDSDKLLQAVSIPTPPTTYVTSLEEATAFAKKHKWPVVLKMSAPGLLHKKDLGGVYVGIGSEEKLESTWDKLEYKIAELEESVRSKVKIQIQEQIINGVEIIVGFKRDPTFGPVMLFGAGGTLAELVMDRNLHLLPIDVPEAKKLVERSTIYKVLKGHRGDPPYALDKLYDLIVRVAQLEKLVPEAESIEINPVLVTLDDVWAVDGKVVFGEGSAVSGPELHITKPSKAKNKFHVAKTLSHDILASTYHYFEFQAEDTMELNPGQYITTKVAENTFRSYSIASLPVEDKFNLLVDVRPGGPGSQFFEKLKVGNKITYLGPFGVFTFKPQDGADSLIFMGTGSGVSPLRCMIESALKEHNFKGAIKLYIGLNHVEDIFWKDYFDKLAKEYPNFSYEIAIFEPDESWEGHEGFITTLVCKDYPDACKTAVYLCGNKNMVKEAIKLLENNGCPTERIYTEKFV
jgi:acetate---CoA ligase (ADP-forming)